MKKTHFIFILFFAMQTLWSQHRVLYQLSNLTKENNAKEQFYLDIDADKSVFYNRVFYINDSIFKKNGQFGGDFFKLSSFVSKNKKSKSVYEWTSIHLYQIELKTIINWKIEKETRVWESKTLQKATCQYGGRDWEAWFCSEIPIHNGPYCFDGLPGLIVQLKSKDDQILYDLVSLSNKKTSEKIDFIQDMMPKAIAISLQKYHQMKIKEYNNPFEYIHDGTLTISEENPLRLANGVQAHNLAELKQAEKSEKIKLEKENHPILLDFKIKYPTNQ